MIKYCEQCKDFHEENDLCPKDKEQLRKHPEWLTEATDFAVVAAQHQLITTQALDGIAQAVNKVAGTNLAYEGTNQFVRDIQVFSKLNSDSFRLSGQFADAETAKQTLENASDGFKRYLRGRLNGTGEEIDWLRQKQGQLRSLFEKSSLPDGNTVGYDGISVNRFTGKTVEFTTVKAAEGQAGLHTNVKDVLEALKKGTLKPNDSLTGIEGTKEAFDKAIKKQLEQALKSGDTEYANVLKDAQKNLKINELGSMQSTRDSTTRLTDKIANGQAHTQITMQEAAKKMANGAVIGAAVSLTISSITNFIKYKNGEITREEAFRNIGEDTVKGTLIGGAMAGITLLLPGGVIGFAAGMAIGVYLNSTCTNILDEVFGKGVYEQILNASGYITGTAKNITEALKEFGKLTVQTDVANQNSRQTLTVIRSQQTKTKIKRERAQKAWEDI